MQSEDILEIDSVEYVVKGQPLFTDVYLSLQAGKVSALFGRNGSGKSTLMKIIYHVLRADHAVIRWNGKYIGNTRSIPGLITYCPQSHYLPGYMKLNEALRLFRIRPENSVIIEEFIDEPGSKRIAQFSGGKLRLLEVLLCLLSDRRFIMLDEPFSQLAPHWVEKIQQLISEVKKSSGILISDHQYYSVDDIADFTHLCMNGAVRKINGLEDLKNSPYLSIK